MVPVQEFTDAADLIAHAAAVRARLYAPRKTVVAAPKPVEVRALPPAAPVPPTCPAIKTRRDYGITSAPMGAEQIEARHYPTMRSILEVVCFVFGASEVEIISQRRQITIVRPRQAAMWLMRKHTIQSLPQIGRFLGDRDHTTVLSATRKVDAVMAEDAAFQANVMRCSALIVEGMA